MCLCVLWGWGVGGYICIIKSAMSGFLQLSLQISMNVSKALITAIAMQVASTLKEVSPVLVTLGTQAMGLHAQVCTFNVHTKIFPTWHNDITITSAVVEATMKYTKSTHPTKIQYGGNLEVVLLLSCEQLISVRLLSLYKNTVVVLRSKVSVASLAHIEEI